jgi:UDP-N-acetylglucosamine 2-epimerase (non-hydrolysing)
MKIACVVGARPNFMKIAPVMEAMAGHPVLRPVLVHTGQHYDAAMSKVFFEELGLPAPDVDLGVGSDTQARQTAKVMIEFEAWAAAERPDYVLVVGDVNSTLAASLVAAKQNIRLGHVEAGLRSFDREMPEEVNRLVTDALADDLFTSCEDAAPNLLREGVDPARIHFVGNVMIDSLVHHREKAGRSTVLADLGLEDRGYTLVTLHRPSNVDEPEVFRGILSALGRLAAEKPVLFPVHPRTRKRVEEFGFGNLVGERSGLRLVDPLGYLDFLRLMDRAALLVTDSGGIQEETTFLGVPCLTVRLNTERPVTVAEGTNELVGVDPERIVAAGTAALRGGGKKGRIPKLWDGKSGERIVNILNEVAEGRAV